MEREVGGGIGMGNTCKPMAVSFQCMTKSTTNKKKKEKEKEKINPNHNTKSCCMWYTKCFYPIHTVSVWGRRRKINICSLLKFIKSKEYPQGS